MMAHEYPLFRATQGIFMIRPNLLAIGLVSLLALTSCNKAEQATTPAGKSVTDVTSAAKDKDKVDGAVSGFTNLTGVVTNTKAAVDAGDFGKAKTEFGKFEGFWAKVEDGVKSKSPAAYDAIETNVKSVEKALASADKAKATDALKALGTAIATATKP
jgi:high-affinity Fe2+/Pb2+ permease